MSRGFGTQFNVDLGEKLILIMCGSPRPPPGANRDKETEIFKILKMRQCVKNFKLQRPIYTDTHRNMRDKQTGIFRISENASVRQEF